MAPLSLVRYIATALDAQTERQAREALYQRLGGKLEKRRRLVEKTFRGRVAEGFVPDLQKALDCPRDELQGVIGDTKRELWRAAWEEHFQTIGPHIYLVTFGRPSPLFAAACVYHHKIHPLDGIAPDADAGEVTRRVKVILPDVPRGVPAYGLVQRLDVYLTPDSGYSFDLQGDLIGDLQGSGHAPGTISLR